MSYSITCGDFLYSELLYSCEYIRVIGCFKSVLNLELMLMSVVSRGDPHLSQVIL
jgi:hypothetical protein